MRESFVISIFIGLVTANSKYCDPKLCSNDKQHIACGNSGAFFPTCPANKELVELSEANIQLILNNHNLYRNKIASGDETGFLPAARMATMTWDDELADLAALNVKQCKMKHDACRSTHAYKFAGQNLAYRANSGAFEPVESSIEKVVQNWYDEVNNAAQSDIDNCCKPASGKTIGHFTQVVTDRAVQVGCAIARYTEKQWKTTLMACNYAFTNLSGAKVYISGKSASGCKSGTNSDFPALCSTSEAIKASP